MRRQQERGWKPSRDYSVGFSPAIRTGVRTLAGYDESASETMAKPSLTCNIFPESCVRHPQSLTASSVGTRSIPVVGVEPAAELGPLRLLVVAEDEFIRQTVCDTAGGTSFTSCAAASATEARTLLRQRGADLLLVDIDLPQNGALDLLAEVAADSPRTDVVVMTGFASAAAAMEAMRSGAHDYLAKPFTAGDLRLSNRRIVWARPHQ